MSTRRDVTFGKMARTFPMRTGLFTFGPVLFALVQLVNAYLHGASLLYAALFAALMVAFSVLVTRYHLVSFRLRRLTDAVYRGD